MEYKKDTRTKNLTLRDIHVGDWVQVWSEQAERYSPPMKIISIHDDGTIYLVTSEEERCTPFEENIKNVDVLLIDEDILREFGFTLREFPFTSSTYRKITNSIYYGDTYLGILCKYPSGKTEISKENHNYKFIHEFFNMVHQTFPIKNLEWKGIEK